jgi:hypothetical protein
MTTGLLVYAQDFDGVFPFMATMHGNTPDPNETWLADWLACPNPLNALETVRTQPEEDWPACAAVPTSGTLFPYIGDPDVYRCPEFERVSDAIKIQNTFNYTRPWWGRLWRSYREEIELYGSASSDWGGIEYEIMTVSDIHKPSELGLVVEEQWDRHVAVGDYFGDDGSGYIGADYGFYVHNVIGAYHGPPVASDLHKYDITPGYVQFLWKQGTIGYYDGHVALKRDPWPTYELGTGYQKRSRVSPKEFRCNGAGKSGFDEIHAVQSYMMDIFYAQRGFDHIAAFGTAPAPIR